MNIEKKVGDVYIEITTFVYGSSPSSEQGDHPPTRRTERRQPSYTTLINVGYTKSRKIRDCSECVDTRVSRTALQMRL